MECKDCKAEMEYMLDYSGGTYITKLMICPACGRIQIIGFEEDKNLNINFDKRYYEYR